MALPELFGSYLLHHQLARGGTSEVFLAQTTGEFPRLCTIKRIRRELASLPEFNERFRRDAELLVRLQHGNVVQVLEVGAVEQQPFIAMEHIDGVEVSELVEKTAEQGALPPELCLHVAIEMCEAAAHLRMRRREREGSAASAHDAPWPLELMISFDGAVKIVDLGSFGALRLGSQPVRRLMRSPGYALPEVVLKRELGASADVFAVGLVLWEMLAGRRLVADDPEGYVRAVLDGRFEAPPIERRDVPGDVIRLCAEALQLDPAARLAGLEPLRKRLVESLRRVAPAYGSGAVSRLLWQRFPQLIGRAEALVARVAADAPAMSVSPSERAGRTDTYGLYDGDSAPKPRALKVGERIPGTRYRLVRMLGRGGSASVFAGQHIDLERQVAIKILSPQLQNNSEAISQFRLEARACSRISHPNIVDVIDFGELADGRFFFAMELVDGVSLADVLAKRPALSIERVIPIVRQVCKAIHAAHGQGIIHRDIKPENVMLVRRDDRESFVKVLDFGVMAHASDRQRVRVGTPGYMAPEQVAGERPTPAMDIYGLGCMFYELLASKTPYPHEPLEKFIHLQATKPPPALRSHAHAANVHEAIERVILRCLERDPEARYASMEELESAVVAAQREAEIETEWDDLAVPGQSAATTRRVAEPPKRRRSQRATPMMMFGVVLALGAIAAGAALVIDTMRRDRGRAGSGSALAHTRTGSATGSGVTQTSAGSGSARVRPLPATHVTSPAAAALIAKIEAAAKRGEFTEPRKRSALDLLEALEKLEPGSPEGAQLRRRIAHLLEGAGDRLWAGKMIVSARTLYREALLFTPDNDRLARLAYPAASDIAGRQRQIAARAKARRQRKAAAARKRVSDAKIAWLVSEVQRAVAEGRYLAPSGRSAFAYLERLKLLDPTGKRSAEARRLIHETMKQEAERKWRGGQRAEARKMYQVIKQLHPEDRVARARAAGGDVQGNGSGSGSAGALAPRRKADRAQLEKLVKEGHALLRQGKPQQAEASFLAAMRLRPRYAPAIAGLATAKFERGKYMQAVEFAERALRINRRRKRTLMLLGDANYRLLRYRDALAAWQRVLALEPGHKRAAQRIAMLKKRHP